MSPCKHINRSNRFKYNIKAALRKYIYNKLKLATAASIAWEWFNNNRVRNGQGVTSAAFTAALITQDQTTVAEHPHPCIHPPCYYLTTWWWAIKQTFSTRMTDDHVAFCSQVQLISFTHNICHGHVWVHYHTIQKHCLLCLWHKIPAALLLIRYCNSTTCISA